MGLEYRLRSVESLPLAAPTVVGNGVLFIPFWQVTGWFRVTGCTVRLNPAGTLTVTPVVAKSSTVVELLGAVDPSAAGIVETASWALKGDGVASVVMHAAVRGSSRTLRSAILAYPASLLGGPCFVGLVCNGTNALDQIDFALMTIEVYDLVNDGK